MVIDTDGSAFITKAEFDSLKNNFQAQIDNYNNSIDSKIDGAIAAYLSGVSTSQTPTYYVQDTDNISFMNDLGRDGFRADQGIIDLSHTRINRTYGLLRASTGSKTWYTVDGGGRYIWATDAKGPSESVYNVSKTLGDASLWNASTTKPSSTPHGYIWLRNIDGNNQYADFNITLTGNALVNEFITRAKAVFSTNNPGADDKATVINCIYWTVVSTYLKKGQATAISLDGGSAGWVIGTAEDGGPASPVPDYRNDTSIYNYVDDSNYGIGFSIENKNGNKFLKKYHKQISIQNIYQFQEYSYYKKDDDTYYKNQDGWTVTAGTTGNKQFEPDLLWTRQENGEKRALNDTSTTNSTYVSYLMSQLKVDDGDKWNDSCQLGIPTWTNDIRCFDESCVREVSSEVTIPSDALKFNIIGYYLDTSGSFKENSNCYIASGPVKYKSMSWKSNLIEPHDLCQERFTNVCGEPVYLGGGVPLCQTSTETTGSKVKLHYKVTKLDGSPIDSAAGDIPIKITLSNKQFVNGNLASGAANRGEFTATVNSSSPEGDWTSNSFVMGIKEKLWLNAYANKKGYNVVISNIDVS